MPKRSLNWTEHHVTSQRDHLVASVWRVRTNLSMSCVFSEIEFLDDTRYTVDGMK
jgi:hypothetical protein